MTKAITDREVSLTPLAERRRQVRADEAGTARNQDHEAHAFLAAPSYRGSRSTVKGRGDGADIGRGERESSRRNAENAMPSTSRPVSPISIAAVRHLPAGNATGRTPRGAPRSEERRVGK